MKKVLYATGGFTLLWLTAYLFWYKGACDVVIKMIEDQTALVKVLRFVEETRKENEKKGQSR